MDPVVFVRGQFIHEMINKTTILEKSPEQYNDQFSQLAEPKISEQWPFGLINTSPCIPHLHWYNMMLVCPLFSGRQSKRSNSPTHISYNCMTSDAGSVRAEETPEKEDNIS